MPSLTRTGNVSVLDLGDDENRFSPDRLDEVLALLDEAEADPETSALVTTARGKFWTNGLDVDWMSAHPTELGPYLDRVHLLLARVLAFPAPTAAAVTGHAFGAGAMLALAHDWRYMRADRGYLCLPEVDLGLPFSPGMLALLQAKLTPAQATDTMLTAHRFGGAAAQAAGLVSEALPEAEVVDRAVAQVQALTGKPAGVYGTVKRDMYAAAVTVLGG